MWDTPKTLSIFAASEASFFFIITGPKGPCDKNEYAVCRIPYLLKNNLYIYMISVKNPNLHSYSMLVIHPKRGKELRPFGWVLLACVWFVSGTWMVPSWAAVTDSTPWSLLTEEGKWEVWWDAASTWVFPKIGVKPRKMHGENNGTPN